MKGRSEIFQVVRLNFNEHTADLLGLETDFVEHGVHWTMLESAGDDGAWMTGQADPWRVL
jgi:hypothetical protein